MTPEALTALHARAFTTPRPFTAKEFRALLDTPGCFLCTAPHGFALGRVIADEAELLTIAVDPEHTRQGVGRHLLAAFEAEARRREATRAHLEVAANNTAAQALYAAQRYLAMGQRNGYYRMPDGTRVDAVILQKALVPA